jgi:SAM-dependent methyltransferase
MGESDPTYTQALAGEGAFWDNFVAQRLRRGEMPGSIDWRLTFSQFRYNHGWRPFSLGPRGINFRMREINYLLTIAAPRPGVRVLDLGCGAGWLSLELARRGAHVTGLDISPTNLALARYMAETNARNFPFLYQNFAGLPCRLEDFGSIEHLYADLNTVNLPPNEYDAVVVWDSLHHVAELERLLDQVRTTLRPGGLFLGMDHAFATPRTIAFNHAVYPWLVTFCKWLTEEDPASYYEGINILNRRYDWRVLAVDYDPTPLPDFARFSEELFGEMLGIIRSSLQDSPNKATSQEEESPFEDVSAQRLIDVLRRDLQPELFTTVCPLITPEEQIPHYRHEQERIFQHYLGNILIDLGEQAIAADQADGQWFLFSAGPESKVPSPKSRVSSTDFGLGTLDSGLERIDPVAYLTDRLDRKRAYIAYLEAELERKNAALAEMEAHLRQLEAELDAARAPKLPWKRRR